MRRGSGRALRKRRSEVGRIHLVRGIYGMSSGDEKHVENIPNAAICSLVRTGWKPTKGTCMLAKVPIAYHEEYATYRRLLKRPMRMSVNACSGIMFVINA